MKSLIKKYMVALVAVGTAGLLPAGTVFGGTNINSPDPCVQNPNAYGCRDGLMVMMTTIVQWVLGILGFVAVVIIIYGGVRYMTSAGDSSKVKDAKNTILYGIIGLVIALLAFAIVSFIMRGISAV